MLVVRKSRMPLPGLPDIPAARTYKIQDNALRELYEIIFNLVTALTIAEPIAVTCNDGWPS